MQEGITRIINYTYVFFFFFFIIFAVVIDVVFLYTIIFFYAVRSSIDMMTAFIISHLCNKR